MEPKHGWSEPCRDNCIDQDLQKKTTWEKIGTRWLEIATIIIYYRYKNVRWSLKKCKLWWRNFSMTNFWIIVFDNMTFDVIKYMFLIFVFENLFKIIYIYNFIIQISVLAIAFRWKQCIVALCCHALCVLHMFRFTKTCWICRTQCHSNR
jgi:hypothetical protein